ncbi:MAG TPA: BBE domain-containing protein, partial [Actinomycetota bacterium]
MRKHGLTCDAVRSMDVVTADGEFVRASEDENHDLYWGLRGGGGNFGIVTSFELDVYPIGPTVTAGFAFYPAEEAPKVLAFVRDFAAEAPEEVTLIVALRNAPAAPYVPESIRGQPVVAVGVCYAGDPERGMRELAPLEEFGPPSVDLIEPKPFRAHQSTLDQGVPNGLAYYWKSHYLDDLTDDVVRVLVERSWPTPTAMSYTLLFQMGGAIRRLGEDDTAFSGRAAGYAININSVAAEGEDQAVPIEWCREYFKALEPHAVGVYMNFLDQEGHERVVSAYGQEKFDRLRALKDRYDPTNFFRMNQNIPPTGH